MRTTYLAIFESSQENIAKLKDLLAETIDSDDLEKMFEEDGKTRACRVFESKLEPLVNKLLSDLEDKEDIVWSVFEVIISDDFFDQLDPDATLDFDKRYSIDLLPERILLPNGEWTKDKSEEVLNDHKHGYIYVFFSIDN